MKLIFLMIPFALGMEPEPEPEAEPDAAAEPEPATAEPPAERNPIIIYGQHAAGWTPTNHYGSCGMNCPCCRFQVHGADVNFDVC
eukprot:SAG11_NODE_31437_length_291_cov_29.333333_1_plen_84_part_10